MLWSDWKICEVCVENKNNNKEFYGSELTENEGKRLSEEVIQAIKNNEAIEATDASFKNEKMGGMWIIEDDYIIKRVKSELVSNQWMHNMVIVTEVTIILYLVNTVVRNIGANESGNIKAYTNCKKLSNVLASERTKASQFELDGRGIISKIIH